MSTSVKEPVHSKIARLENTILELEKRIVQLEQSAHSEHTLGVEAIDHLVKQVIVRVGNGLTSLAQQPAE